MPSITINYQIYIHNHPIPVGFKSYSYLIVFRKVSRITDEIKFAPNWAEIIIMMIMINVNVNASNTAGQKIFYPKLQKKWLDLKILDETYIFLLKIRAWLLSFYFDEQNICSFFFSVYLSRSYASLENLLYWHKPD